MPQAPLPAPAARLVPQTLFTGMHAGTSTPQDVIQHQWNIDMLDKAKKGVELGSMIAQLPTVGAQNVLERSYAQLATERAKALQDEIKQIGAQYPGPENAQRRSLAVEDAMIRYGYKQTGTQGGFDTQVPLGVYGKDYFINRGYNAVPPAPVNNNPKGNVQVGEVTRTDGNTNNPNPNPSAPPNPNPSATPSQDQPGFKIPHSGGQSAMLFNPGNNGNGIQLVSAPNMGSPLVQNPAYPVIAPYNYNYNTGESVYPNAPLA